MDKKIVILKDYRGFLRQNLKMTSMHVVAVAGIFRNNGFMVKEYCYGDVLNDNPVIKGSYIIYSSSQREEYKAYIDDIIYQLSKYNTLIPRYEILRVHENKGFQELFKKERGIESLKSAYFSTENDFLKYSGQIKYPVVFKKVAGSCSQHVYKVGSKEEVVGIFKKINRQHVFTRDNLGTLIDRWLNRSKYKQDYYAEVVPINRFILQEFVPGINEDWKVLVFDDKYYVLNRKVRENDFRASGSGKLFFIDPPEGLLDFSREIFNKLDVPFISLDVCHSGRKFFLLEYQGTHFGPYTLIKSTYYFKHNGKKWEKLVGESVLENEYARSIINYIHRKEKI